MARIIEELPCTVALEINTSNALKFEVMPWDAILAAAVAGSGLGVTVAVALGVLLLQRVVQKSVDLAGKKVESAIDRAEKAYSNLLKMGLQVDLDLRKRRIRAYRDLWILMSMLPKWPHDPRVTYEDLIALSTQMKDWYFGGGGMYLSELSRASYGDLQDEIWKLVSEAEARLQLTESDYEKARERCSTLRTELTKDMLSRRAAPLDQG